VVPPNVSEFFTAPAKKEGQFSDDNTNHVRTGGITDSIDVSTLDEDEVELLEEDFRPAKATTPESTVKDPQKDWPTTMAMHTLGPICPICSKALGPTTSNQGLNEHIDLCLSEEAIITASTQTLKKTDGKNARRRIQKSTIKDWLGRET
jgi:hypothetical protein